MVYLKSIDTVGFKSFADRTNVQFDKGVTAIVGPNGSGKSNITDAIKWVLGEQSAKSLRGSKMEDIIFSGAEHRQAQNYAEVQLKLDNSTRELQIEADDVIVTRRLYRSGESEYYLNNDRARLRDITELFLDSGLGKEAFSIISQGRVDEILNAKPVDRRQIIEESAGVLKYKKRKTESLQKLGHTEDNLSRVEDILYDLEGRVEPLKAEASIAKEYLQLSKEMEHSDVVVTVHDINQYDEENRQLDERLNHLKSQQAEKEGQQAQLNQYLQKQKTQRQKLERDTDHTNIDLITTTEEYEKFIGKLNVLEERKRNQSETNARFEEELDNLQYELKNVQDERELSVEQVSKLKKQHQSLNKEIKQLESKLNLTDAQHDEKLETIKNEYYELMSEQSEVNNDIRFLERTIQENETKKTRLDARLIEVFDQLKHIQNDIHQTEQAHTTTSQKMNITEKDMRDVEDRLSEAKRILKAKENTLSGIHGAVAEVIKVPSKLTQAIETALGASLQHIIVNNEKDGRQAIKFLKQRGLGRATFLPLNVIRARSLSHHIQNVTRNFDGFINIASEAVEVNQTYQAVIDNLMGTTIIVENLKIANELARAIQYKARIVTLEGDIVNPGGAMTGGGMRQSKSILAQKDELATMKTQLNDYEEKTKEFEQQLQKQKEKVETLSNKYVDLSQQYHQLKDNAHEEKLTLDRLKKQETHIKSEHEEFEFEKNDGYQSEKSRHTLKQQQLRLSEIQEQLKQLENDIEVYSKLSKEGKENVSQVEKELNQKRSDVAVVKEKISHQTMSLERIDKQLAQINQQIIATKEKIELFNSDDMMGEKAFQQLQSSIQDKASQRDKLKQKLDTLKEQKDSINEDIEIHEYKLEQCHQDLLSIESFYQDIKAQQSKLDVLINHAMNHLNETYHLTLERARETYQSDVPIETLRKKVKLTKMSIEELGSVNVNAIEQFEELNERYTFLNEQRNDLREAKQTLEQIIDEMDQEVKDRFKATFFEVQDYFTTVFQSLFGGGHAKLELTDDDYLSAGVDIIVQPPGKKLQNLSLLSGGERALSAIALLFAILKVRSAPFVILDEVEAALDEANVIRYAQFLNDLSEKTQFIVITHRKGTMEYSDRLYGVTMQESGVSKLVSVNLNTIDEVMKEENA